MDTLQSIVVLVLAVSIFINALWLGSLTKRVKEVEQLKELDEAILKRWHMRDGE